MSDHRFSVELPSGWRRVLRPVEHDALYEATTGSLQVLVRRLNLELPPELTQLRDWFENTWGRIQDWGGEVYDLRVRPGLVAGSWYDERGNQTIREWMRVDAHGALNATALRPGRCSVEAFAGAEALVEALGADDRLPGGHALP